MFYKEKSNRNLSELVMNQSDVLNKRNHIANVLDRALPLVENGKGSKENFPKLIRLNIYIQ